MSDPEKTKIDDTEEENDYEDSDEQWSDEESAMRELVLGLPSLRISNEAEAQLNDLAVVAAELVLAAAEEAVIKGKSEDGGSSGKKKIRRRRKISINEETSGLGTGEAKKAKKKSSELTDPPKGPPACNVCGRRFFSWKAVFGHLRTHDRDYKGFNPPPTFSAAAEGYPILGLNSAFVPVTAGEGSSTDVAGGGGGSGGFVGSGVGGASGGEGGRGLGIDLNVEPMEEVEETTETGTIGKFDLNKFPPKDEEDTDDEAK